MDAASVTSAAQRKSKLERQREIMQKKRQQKRALEIHALRTKSFNSLLDTNPVSPRLALKTPARSQQRGVSEKFVVAFFPIPAYDGPQAFELGNPDLLDPPIQILRVSEDNTDGVARSDKSVRSASALTQRVSSADAASKTASTYQAIHIPPTRPMKLPLPVSPLAGPDRRALVDIHEGEREEGEDGGEKKRVVATTSTTREAGGRRTKTTRKRQPAAALRPHSAAEAMHSSRGKQANLIDLDDVDMLSVEASPASAIADWSVTPSTTSGVSFHWREKTQPDSSRYREVSAQKAGRPVKRRVKKPSPVEAPSGPKTGTSKKSQRTQKPVRVRRQEKPQSRDIPARINKRTYRHESGLRVDSTGDKESTEVSSVLHDTPRKCPPAEVLTGPHHTASRPVNVDGEAVESKTSPARTVDGDCTKKKKPGKHDVGLTADVVLEGSSQGVDKGEEGVRSKITRIFNAGDDVEEFVRSPAPKGVTVRCRISRDKRGLERGLFPNYFLHLEREEDNRRFFLLAARRRRRAAANCNYAISLDAADSLDSSNSDHSLTVGRLRSNFLGTRFVLSSCRNYNRHDTCCSVSGGLGDNSKEIAAVTYVSQFESLQTNLSFVLMDKTKISNDSTCFDDRCRYSDCGISTCNHEISTHLMYGPRRMTVLLPREDEHRNPPNPHVPTSSTQANLNEVNASSSVIELHNKRPMWNEGTQSYVLNFHGRVTQPSVKNFQLIDQEDESNILMQFGKISSDVFTMDYTYPLTALQAFGIAISSLTGKLACE
ncbi:unnamed protein product [Mesocestoides corti]|uniref:Tubby C-terminal domain-containing protein n=1 Tax=Mesocestoides corti TaxID=53468 RepID=A0A158QSU3_MESCO|nr:unnamed protein product [Mesocestoides corti]